MRGSTTIETTDDADAAQDRHFRSRNRGRHVAIRQPTHDACRRPAARERVRRQRIGVWRRRAPAAEGGRSIPPRPRTIRRRHQAAGNARRRVRSQSACPCAAARARHPARAQEPGLRGARPCGCQGDRGDRRTARLQAFAAADPRIGEGPPRGRADRRLRRGLARRGGGHRGFGRRRLRRTSGRSRHARRALAGIAARARALGRQCVRRDPRRRRRHAPSGRTRERARVAGNPYRSPVHLAAGSRRRCRT
jgi:hypothetical protein